MLARWLLAAVLPLAVLAACQPGSDDLPYGEWSFTDVTAEAGLNYRHGYVDQLETISRFMAGGAAAGDYDGDGLVDLYVVRGDIGPNLLFRNLGDGTFTEVGASAGVDVDNSIGAGPTFVDLNGDGHLDLFVGGLEQSKPRCFLNRSDGTFVDDTIATGLALTRDTYSVAAGDYDQDSDLDLLITHWGTNLERARDENEAGPEHLWRNNGDATFSDMSVEVGLQSLAPDGNDFTFTPNFVDIDNDGWLDLLVASDFGMSRVFLNLRDGTFDDVTTPVISDENGMGGTVGDYDNDGDLDWFVTSIFDADGGPNSAWGISGNRLYRNEGGGEFSDVTDEAGVRDGSWGWATCFADFNNDGHLDLFHVNGFGSEESGTLNVEFAEDRSRLFMSNGDGTFDESSVELGIDDRGDGRGLVCFDYDRDGDIDVFVANHGQEPQLFRNDGTKGTFLQVKLRGARLNTEAIGARISVTAGGSTQTRELRSGSNYLSQDPAEAHFGLGTATSADRVHVVWPDGEHTVLEDVAAGQYLLLDHPSLADGVE